MGRGCGGRGLGVGSAAYGKSERAPERKELGLLLPRLLLSFWEKWLSLGSWGGSSERSAKRCNGREKSRRRRRNKPLGGFRRRRRSRVAWSHLRLPTAPSPYTATPTPPPSRPHQAQPPWEQRGQWLIHPPEQPPSQGPGPCGKSELGAGQPGKEDTFIDQMRQVMA